MSYTNTGLVEYAKRCLELGNNSVYIYGSFGNKVTNSFCNSKYRQYPKVNTQARTTKYKQLCDGKHYAFDCVGLIKSYYWGGFGKTKYNSSNDVSANGMYNKAKVKGNISTMDKSKIGLLVQMDGHIGIYIGNDEVIESTISHSHSKLSHGLGGVCKTKLSARKWTHWLECPYITYEEVKAPVKPETPKPAATNNFLPKRGYFRLGDYSVNVGKIATFMRNTFPAYTSKSALGNLYGVNLRKAIKEFQRRVGLTPDGCVGPLTLAKLKQYGFKY